MDKKNWFSRFVRKFAQQPFGISKDPLKRDIPDPLQQNEDNDDQPFDMEEQQTPQLTMGVPAENVVPLNPPQEEETPLQPDQTTEPLPVHNPQEENIFEIPLENYPKFVKKMTKIQKFAEQKGLAVPDFLPKQDNLQGSVFKKAVADANGILSYFDFVKVQIVGDLPSPRGTAIRMMRDDQGRLLKDEQGNVQTKEYIYELIGNIEFLPKEEPREVEFPSLEEAQDFVSEQAEPALWMALMRRNKEGNVVPMAYYEGKFGNVVKPYPGAPPLDAKFEYTSPLLCEHCGRKQRGLTARKWGYIAIEFDPDILQGRTPTPQEKATGKQIQVGSSCIQGHKAAIDIIEDVTKLKQATKESEKQWRQSNSFGGGWRSAPKDLLQVLANAVLLSKKGGRYHRNISYTLKSWFMFGDPNRQQDPSWGKPSPEDEAKAKEIKDWWSSRADEPGLDREERNTVNVSLQKEIGLDHFWRIPQMIEGYEDAHRPPAPPPVEEPVLPQEESPIAPKETSQPTSLLDDISRVQQGSAFVAKLKFVSSFSFRGPYGLSHLNKFKDDNDKEYVYFSGKRPFNATKGDDVFVRGIRGEDKTYQGRQNIIIKKVTLLDPAEVSKYQKGIEVPEAPAIEEQKQEPPVEEKPAPPVEEKPETNIEFIERMNERAKKAIMEGGKDPNEIIPLYVRTVKKKFPEFDDEQWERTFKSVYESRGLQSLFSLFTNLPRLLQSLFPGNE